MFRYVALIWDVSDPTQQPTATRLSRQLTQGSSDWNRVLNSPGVQVFCRTSRLKGSSVIYPLAHESGVLLGSVFHRSSRPDEVGRSHDLRFTEEETDKIVASCGRGLVDWYWGRYVAFVIGATSSSTWIVKDPTGRLPCFVAQSAGVTVVFSYMPDCVALGVLPLKINWNFVAARVALGCGRPEDTGIEDVSELCGGECLEFRPGGQARHLYWDPSNLSAREAADDPDLAANSLRTTTKACVHAWASLHDTFLHRLSGGLDSSIVLSCLADAPSRPRIICLTYYRSGSVSDERPWARLAAQRAGCEHIEYARDPRINFGALSHMGTCASPPLTSSFLETDTLEGQLTDRYGVTAICSGDGGDSLFGSTSARYCLMDYVRRRGIRPTLLGLASDVALLRNQSVWKVISTTLHHAIFSRDREDPTAIREARKLTCSEIREPLLAVRTSFVHRWFRSGRVAPAAREILSFLTLPDLFYPPLSDPDSGGPEGVCPLLSQPLVELSLNIPSYLHFDQGRDRGLARRAFMEDVPAPILTRTWKDRVQGFPEEIVQTNRPYFREMLLDGILVKEGYLDRRAVETSLSGSTVKDTGSVGEIIDHVLVEAWLRTWISRGSVKR